MTLTHDWLSEFESEIEFAQKARQQSNEGMARVCARRAAGIIAGEYLRRKKIPFGSTNAYEKIRLLENLPGLPSHIREVVGHFLVRITPEHELPVQADLIVEAGWLKQILLEDYQNT